MFALPIPTSGRGPRPRTVPSTLWGLQKACGTPDYLPLTSAWLLPCVLTSNLMGFPCTDEHLKKKLKEKSKGFGVLCQPTLSTPALHVRECGSHPGLSCFIHKLSRMPQYFSLQAKERVVRSQDPAPREGRLRLSTAPVSCLTLTLELKEVSTDMAENHTQGQILSSSSSRHHIFKPGAMEHLLPDSGPRFNPCHA